MANQDRVLLIEQLDRKIGKLAVLKEIEPPGKGWINTIRTSLNMTLAQLGMRLNITSVSVKEIELREENRGITLKKLYEVAESLNCRFVYGFIPNEGSFEKMIEKRALEIAKEIVYRSSHTMMLEDQENSEERIKKAIKSRSEQIRNELPKYLWD